MKVVIVLPTFNERENIGPLIQSLQGIFANLSHEMHLVVADDLSPDGTGQLVRRMRGRYDNVHLSEGPKKGLGAAYLRGMEFAVSELKADVIFEMDADFSHSPTDVPRLLNEIEMGYDFVIGSRYVAGGSIPGEWGWYRRLVSRTGNLVARYVAGIHNVRDCTGGFRAITREVIQRVDWSAVQVQGYAFQVALLHAAVVAGGRVREIPIHFLDRTHGKSQLGFRDIVEFIKNAWWIRFRGSKTFMKFTVVGLTGVAVNLGAFSFLLWSGITAYIASPIAIELSIVSNFLLNNYWTFKSRNTKSGVRIKGIKFNMVSLLALGISYSTFLIILFLFPEWPPHVAQALAIPPAMFLNYFLNSRWTFRHIGDKRIESL